MDYDSQICVALDCLADGKEKEAQRILDLCITTIKKNSKEGKNSAEEYYFWGMCLYHMNEPEQALLKYEKAIQVDPSHERSIWQITNILFYTQQSAESALSILENKLLKINPDNKEYQGILADIKIYLKHIPKNEKAS